MSDTPSPSRIDSHGVHALSNQMAVILGFVEVILADTSPDDPRRDDLVEVQRAATECARILAAARTPPK